MARLYAGERFAAVRAAKDAEDVLPPHLPSSGACRPDSADGRHGGAECRATGNALSRDRRVGW